MSDSLYQINDQINRLLEMDDEWVDTETGELLSYAEVEALEMAREEKLENWALWVKNQQALINGIKAEEKNLKERRDRLEARLARSAEHLQGYLAGEKLSTARVSVTYRKSEAVEIFCPVDDVPENFQRVKTTVEPDKTALKAALKAGEEIAGCRLVTRQSMNIR